jgi:hypothetical protein
MIYPDFEFVSSQVSAAVSNVQHQGNFDMQYKTSIYAFGVDHVLQDSEYYHHVDNIQISHCPYVQHVEDGMTNYVWREETGESWIDYRKGEYLYSFKAKVNLTRGLLAYSHFPRLLQKISSEFDDWMLDRIYHTDVTFSDLMVQRELMDGVRCIDTLYHETNELVHWHRCWHCVRPFRQKHQIVGFKHSHSCGAVLCNACRVMEPKFYFLWKGVLRLYNPAFEPREFVHQGLPDMKAFNSIPKNIEETTQAFTNLAEQMQGMIDKSDASLEQVTAMLKDLLDTMKTNVVSVATSWMILAAIAGFVIVLSYFLSRRRVSEAIPTDVEVGEEVSENVPEHQAYDSGDSSIKTMDMFTRAAELVDSIIALPWRLMDFVKSRWSTMVKLGRDLYSFKQGFVGLEFFASKCGEILQDFLKWATGKQIFLTELSRQKYVRVAEMSAALNTLRTFFGD